MSHTKTGEWKSFEIRMRHRRAERLVLRAEAAADAGCIEDARACLAEARALAPSLGGIAAVEARLNQSPQPVRRRLVWPRAVAVLAVIALGGWLLRPHAAAPADDTRALTIETRAAAADAVANPPEPAVEPVASAATTERPVEAPRTAAAPAVPDTRNRISNIEVEDRDPAPTRSPAVSPLRPPVPTTGRMTPAPLMPLSTATAPPAPDRPIAPIPIAGAVAAVANAVDALPAPEPAAPAPPAKAPVSVPAAPRADVAVRGVLDRYAAAYSALDADAAARVWPRVNRSALTRAFDDLASQTISLGECRIEIAGAAAHANCAGSATWTPKIGDGTPRTEPRRWRFDLARAGTDWQIIGARVQNR